jgi:hypothetical protein
LSRKSAIKRMNKKSFWEVELEKKIPVVSPQLNEDFHY